MRECGELFEQTFRSNSNIEKAILSGNQWDAAMEQQISNAVFSHRMASNRLLYYTIYNNDETATRLLLSRVPRKTNKRFRTTTFEDIHLSASFGSALENVLESAELPSVNLTAALALAVRSDKVGLAHEILARGADPEPVLRLAIALGKPIDALLEYFKKR
jgi:hypothetical protein